MATPIPSAPAGPGPSSSSSIESSSRALIIETATAACSVALVEGGQVVASAHDVVGRGHAERLVPMIADLPGQGRAGRILVDVGPGSFTGIRVGLAAAIGLSIGWKAPVSGYSSLTIIAAAHFAANPGIDSLAVVIEGGHGEVFMQQFAAPLTPLAPVQSLGPQAALAAITAPVLVGNGISRLIGLTDLPLVEALPDAAHALLLGPDDTDLPPRPVYGRAPDAKTLAERGLA